MKKPPPGYRHIAKPATYSQLMASLNPTPEERAIIDEIVAEVYGRGKKPARVVAARKRVKRSKSTNGRPSRTK